MKRRRLLVAAPSLLLPRRAAATDRLSVLLDWFINPNHAPLVVAEQIGAFARQGLAVSLIQPADPSMPPRLVAAGHGDVAISYQVTLYREVLGGLPILRIGTLQDRSLTSLCVLKSGGIATLAGLKGKRLGYNNVGGDDTLAAIDTMLRTANLSLSDLSLVDVGTALTTSLLTHRVDAVPMLRNFEAFEIADLGQVPVCFDFGAYGVPASDGFVFEVQRDRAGDPRFPRFLEAVREGTVYLKAHPAEAWHLFLRAYPDLDDRLNEQAWNYTLPYFADDPAALDEKKYRDYAAFLYEHKIIRRIPAVSSYALKLAYPPR